MALEQSAAPATTSDAGQAVSPVLDDDGGPSPVEVAQLRENVLSAAVNIPERLSYRIKRALLGEPLVTARLHEEKLSKKAALGVLSSDCISSSAYGTEEMLVALVPVFGLASFHILGPMTAVVIGVSDSHDALLSRGRHGLHEGRRLVCSGARQLRPESGADRRRRAADRLHRDGGGPGRGGHVGDYLSGARRSSTGIWRSRSVLVLVLAYGNLRGIREAGKAFAFPTYFFFFSMTLVIVLGIGREILGDLPQYATDLPGQFPVTNQHDAILSWAAIFVLLKAFANGGSSLTGLEAISNGVSAFKPPAGVNARRTLSLMSRHARLSRRRSLVSGRADARCALHGRRADRDQSGGQGGIRDLVDRARGLHLGAARDRIDPLHRREHAVHRLPVPGELRRRGLLPAPPADSTRAPAGVQQRDHRAHRQPPSCCCWRWARTSTPGAVLRHRRVHRLHDGRPRHGQVPLDTTRAGMATKARDQLRGRHRARCLSW